MDFLYCHVSLPEGYVLFNHMESIFFNGGLSFVLFLVFSREGQIKTENEGSTWKSPRIFVGRSFADLLFFGEH